MADFDIDRKITKGITWNITRNPIKNIRFFKVSPHNGSRGVDEEMLEDPKRRGDDGALVCIFDKFSRSKINTVFFLIWNLIAGMKINWK